MVFVHPWNAKIFLEQVNLKWIIRNLTPVCGQESYNAKA
jgi:hypothetical protein